jgi:hypothetical protein
MADDDPDGPGPVADDLYGLDPADFVAGRTELARRLRAEKDRARAAQVAKLRRPSPAAWAVNQLARRQRADLEALVGLGETLRAAQARALEGADAADLRRATRARRDAIAALTGAAAQLLASRGAGVDAHLPGVTATLEAASLDPDLGATVLGGRLSAELRPPSGFGEAGPQLVEPPWPEEAPPQPGPEPQTESERAARQLLEEARAAAREAARQEEALAAAARVAGTRAGERRRAVEEAEAAVDRLRQRLLEAQQRLEEAERSLAAARGEADQAVQAALDADATAAAAAERRHDTDRRLRQAAG